MKKLQQAIFLFLAITISTSTQAQLGSLVKKAKDKVTEKKVTTTTSDVGSKPTETVTEPNKNKQYEAGVFLFPERYNGNSFGYNSNNFINLYKIKEKYGVLESLSHVRKEGEKGTFHFAKDYPELKDLINDEHIVNAAIQFSGTPFKNGKGDGKASFSSNGEHIYAQLEAKAGTIKDVFNIKTDENIRFSFTYYIYSDDADKLTGNFQTSMGNFIVTPQMAKEKYLVLDIMPAKENAVVYANKEMGLNSTASSFAYLHTQENFSKSGNYKVRLVLLTPYTDEWGKPISGTSMDCNSFFDYTFSSKDAKARVDEGSALYTYMKENINNAPVALPEEWSEKTSPLTMGVTQAKLVEMYRNSYNDKLADFILVKLHASNSNGGWTIQKNESGIPSYRYSGQWYTVFMKSKNGKACFYQGFGLRQDYQGGGQYGASFIDKETYKYVKCEDMK
jgi:hypothetical protein